MSTGRKTLDDLLFPISVALGRNEVPNEPTLHDIPPNPVRITDGLKQRQLVDMFVSEAEKIHVKVSCCVKSEVAAAISAIISAAVKEQPIDELSVVIAADEHLKSFGIASACEKNDVCGHVFTWDTSCSAEENVAKVKDAHFGITYAQYAIAETGTVVQPISATSPRCVSLLPLAHISVVAASSVMPTMRECLCAFDEQAKGVGTNLPSQICFISGPSATSDIELVRVEGVHGPMYEYYVVIDDLL